MDDALDKMLSFRGCRRIRHKDSGSHFWFACKNDQGLDRPKVPSAPADDGILRMKKAAPPTNPLLTNRTRAARAILER